MIGLRGRDLISMDDLTPAEVWAVLDHARDLKRRTHAGEATQPLRGKVLAMIFEKPSLRTRVTFEVGMAQLGGTSIYLAPQDAQLGTRETIPDAARNLERWVDVIMARTFAHATVVELARWARVPVINGLSDLEHPCQTLADLLTLYERFGGFRDVTVAWVGDGNNVCHSLMLGAAKVGLNVVVATPPGFRPNAGIVERARAVGRETGAALTLMDDPREAVAGVDAIYTDVWASMGQEAEREERARIFRPYQVNAQLLARAKPTAVVLHCLPVHRGEEITDEVLDGEQSVVFDQAENRLHAQKALLAMVVA
ncbi:MAG: ornithine carbamoyltransferase [Armatimonadota bacterium]|nr:ornithine carbamoyltransferase [Armatimonadota bacterium]MDR7526664.1 ornithine carbamoyltransferase [Armatimonadota bacterium]MDR7543900.1 ornithine carbamoyltransferase [Armatimonadota bacterium]